MSLKMTSYRFNGRLVIACLAAASAGLSVVIISLSKVLLVISALVVILRGRPASAENDPLQRLWTPKLVLVILLAFACSLAWTSAPTWHALGAMGKYGKLLVIPALLVVIRTRREAGWALATFVGAQFFLLASSWLLYFHVPLAWATSNLATTSYSVFSSYLDQGIMSAAAAAIFWHLKALAPNRFVFYAAVGASVLALGNVFVVFLGRTGHLVGIAMISLAIFWSLPKRYRFAALLVPPLIFLVAFFSFNKVAMRFSAVIKEVSAYSVKAESVTSSGVRLSFWRTSAEAILAKPLHGSGVGSWATEYNKIEDLKNPTHEVLHVGSNPHEEFLLWGVQLGIGGIVLLAALLSAVLLDFLKMDSAVARAGQSVLVALVLSCLLNSSIYDAYIGDFFCLSLGVLMTYGFRRLDVCGQKAA